MAKRHQKFAECSSCVNFEFDPWVCRYCKNADHHETAEPYEEEVDDMSYQDFLDMVRSNTL